MTAYTFLLEIAEDAFFAAVAGTGFAVISHPPLRTLPVCALLAAIGHSLRFFLMNVDGIGLHICLASFAASLCIGFLAVFFSLRQSVSVEVYAFPSLLPMIPGMYAYRTMHALTAYLNCGDESTALHYINLFFHNGLTAVFVLCLLVIGVVIPTSGLSRLRFSANRRRRKRGVRRFSRACN